jgi:hypothetical protein
MGLSYRVRGRYLESCNCEAICPCRRIDGVFGGRSTSGICFGVLSWAIEAGTIEEVDVGGLAVALVYRYDDDEEGSPWTLALHVDARGHHRQRAALGRLFLDELVELPWIRKARDVVGVRTSPIEIEGTTVRIGSSVSVRATRAFETDLSVTCIVPGHHQPGRELYADELRVDDGPFAWELAGNCAYAADFEYVSTERKARVMSRA